MEKGHIENVGLRGTGAGSLDRNYLSRRSHCSPLQGEEIPLKPKRESASDAIFKGMGRVCNANIEGKNHTHLNKSS